MQRQFAIGVHRDNECMDMVIALDSDAGRIWFKLHTERANRVTRLSL